VLGKAFEARQRVRAVDRLGHGKALGLERVGDELSQRPFVLDDENRSLAGQDELLTE